MKKTLKILIVIVILLIIFASSFLIFNALNNGFEHISFEEEHAKIDTLYIYGKHLNLNGTLNIDLKDTTLTNLDLILKNKDEETYKLIYNVDNNVLNFKVSELKNTGINLDTLKKGNYILFLKAEFKDANNKHSLFKYYKLDNQTTYPTTTYYTLKKDDKFNQVLIKNDSDDTLSIDVSESKDTNVYDIVIDAGHGGIDPGACANGHCETDFTLTLAKKLKAKLEEKGLKIKLTRDDETSSDVKFETYGEDGRIDRAMQSKAKYLFSFHLNSGLASRCGIEVYTTNHIDYTLARAIAKSVNDNTPSSYSNNPIFYVEDGIYTRTFLNYEIDDMNKDASIGNYDPYNITTDTTYYYIIRETGGFMNGAYTDGRDANSLKNPYVNTNVGIESYIIELGYITNAKDLENIKKNMDSYIDAISEAIIYNI